jgi:putative transposase
MRVDCSFYEFKCQLTYKCEWYSSKLVIAHRFDYPSSQLCSQCGQRQKMPLGKRTYKFSNCGFSADRDYNAVVNLKTMCRSSLSSKGTVVLHYLVLVQD